MSMMFNITGANGDAWQGPGPGADGGKGMALRCQSAAVHVVAQGRCTPDPLRSPVGRCAVDRSGPRRPDVPSLEITGLPRACRRMRSIGLIGQARLLRVAKREFASIRHHRRAAPRLHRAAAGIGCRSRKALSPFCLKRKGRAMVGRAGLPAAACRGEGGDGGGKWHCPAPWERSPSCTARVGPALRRAVARPIAVRAISAAMRRANSTGAGVRTRCRSRGGTHCARPARRTRGVA